MPDCSHDDFPESLAPDASIRTIEADRGARHVHVHLDVPYRTASGQELHLHIIQSCLDLSYASWDEMAAERLPCIAFVQGSGWRPQEMGTSMDFWVRFAHRGYVIVLVEYRPSDIAPFPAQVEDAQAALAWLAEHHDRFGIDRDRIALAGDSSGGHTTLMVHATQEGAAPLARAFVDFYGPTDLSIGNSLPTAHDHELADSPEGRLLGGRDLAEVPELVARANPSLLVGSAPLAPLLMVHGTKDRVVPLEHSLRHYRVLREAGHSVEMVQVRDADHGSTPSLFSDQLADIVDEFLRTHLTGQPEG